MGFITSQFNLRYHLIFRVSRGLADKIPCDVICENIEQPYAAYILYVTQMICKKE
jgi:hypothetical protein